MASSISFFPVGNGDMTLIQTESGKKILIDLNIREAADNRDDNTPDVARELRARLERDDKNRLYVDVLLISHPDKDHCTGLQNHFHLGHPDEWSAEKDKIFVREIWSSPLVFRRASRNYTLCEDAKAFNTEAKRRVRKFLEERNSVGDGNRVLILGEDENGKTDNLSEILVRIDTTFSRINGQNDKTVTARLLGPLPEGDEDEERDLSKNNSSTILQFSLAGGNTPGKCFFMTGGDAEVAIWEKLWRRHSENREWLSYDILQAPHHCSWHCLSYNSWSEQGENAKVCEDARHALSQARDGATIVASSKPIKDDGSDPPCIRAKREYLNILNKDKNSFKCTGEFPSGESPDVMEFEINQYGYRLKTPLMATAGLGIIGRQPLAHG